MKKWK